MKAEQMKELFYKYANRSISVENSSIPAMDLIGFKKAIEEIDHIYQPTGKLSAEEWLQSEGYFKNHTYTIEGFEIFELMKQYVKYLNQPQNSELPVPKEGIIEHDNMIYWFKYKLAKNGNLCLATQNPYEYCNGTFGYSDKDPGDGMEFVVVNYRHKNQKP